jgi:hypothetical protein
MIFPSTNGVRRLDRRTESMHESLKTPQWVILHSPRNTADNW